MNNVASDISARSAEAARYSAPYTFAYSDEGVAAAVAIAGTRFYDLIKRPLDLAVVFLLLPLIIPVAAITALAVRLTSGGPVLFVQKRVGRAGRIFRIYKFRTMSHGTAGPSVTLPGDSRITPLGRFLRRWRIDELPQVINILRGEMSWVGPRPEAVELAELYRLSIPNYDVRHAVLPGIAGWAQIQQGNVGGVDAAKIKFAHDLHYVHKRSALLDALIMGRTGYIVLTGFGAV